MSGDPLADAIREAGGIRYGDVNPERLADAIRSGALAEALADVPAEALGFKVAFAEQSIAVTDDVRAGGYDGPDPIVVPAYYRRVNVGSADA